MSCLYHAYQFSSVRYCVVRCSICHRPTDDPMNVNTIFLQDQTKTTKTNTYLKINTTIDELGELPSKVMHPLVVTLKFDLLTPKCIQHIYGPEYICD